MGQKWTEPVRSKRIFPIFEQFLGSVTGIQLKDQSFPDIERKGCPTGPFDWGQHYRTEDSETGWQKVEAG